MVPQVKTARLMLSGVLGLPPSRKCRASATQPMALEFFRPFVKNLSSERLSIPPPSSDMFMNFALKAHPSAPGIDQLPYSAWGTPEKGTTLQEAFFESAAGRLVDLSWNDQIMIFIAKGDKDDDTEASSIREPTELRPI
eukprot:TRINITY_DN69160_c0_g1_i1.p1 TRINITY_DN69160_c0_g1~~TRINITY_DN69160_c0_g1_i1.p1  ORF type:complete len:153 (+),score=26.63 TRINITY_DN69160_c0_g1_i1:45-461(+)